MSQHEKPTNASPWPAVLGFFGVVLAAYIGFIGVRLQIQIPIETTQTAEARLLTLTAQVNLSSTHTPQPTITPVPTITPTQFICPFQGQTDEETIVNLIQAEAIAVNTKDLNIIMTIFAPNAAFYDYALVPPKESPEEWIGPDDRYEKVLFRTTEFREVEHFDIYSVGSGIDGNPAYYISGSKGSYRIGGEEWRNFNNPSTPSTQYGSDHWVLQKNNNGCWVIIRMDFNAGHIKFP